MKLDDGEDLIKAYIQKYVLILGVHTYLLLELVLSTAFRKFKYFEFRGPTKINNSTSNRHLFWSHMNHHDSIHNHFLYINRISNNRFLIQDMLRSENTNGMF